MGRKGVSKRKLPKSKNQPGLSPSSNGAVSDLTRAPAAGAPKLVGKGEAISTAKGGKRK